MIGETERKVRSDKKRDIKPTVTLELKDSIYRLSYITKKPVKDVCELFIRHSLFESKEIIENLSSYFKRDIRLNNTLYKGNLRPKKILKSTPEETSRISFRLKNETYEILHALAYAMDCSVSRVAVFLLYETITDKHFIEKYVESYIDGLDKSRKKELRELLKYIQAEKGDDSYSLADLVSYLVEEPVKWIFPEK